MTLSIRDDGQIHNTAINLEGCTPEELKEVSKHPAIHRDVRQAALLSMNARALRLDGQIAQALIMEGAIERIYNLLPSHLRW